MSSIGDASCNGIVRRMISLPRNIVGGFSRVMGQGLDLMRVGGRSRNQRLIPSNFDLQYSQEEAPVPEEWAFLTNFEQQYGSMHPFFYVCRFMDALKIAEDEHKFMFMYLHSPEHPFTHSFCRDTLCSELVVQFLDANFVCWAALTNRGEGLQMAASLRPASFPFCALLAPASGNNMVVLQQTEGPIAPAELVEILQRTVEEQGLAFGSGRAKEEEKRRADRRLREEQDAAYLAALQIDKEKDRHKNLTSEKRFQNPFEASLKQNNEKLRHNPIKQQPSRLKEATSTTTKGNPHKEIDQVTQILIRFPNGERREQSFLCKDKVQALYQYINSLGLPCVGNYRLVSSFPRRVYGAEQMGLTLKDAGLHPRASLFVELM